LLAGGTLEQLLERKRSLSEVHTKAVAFALFSALAAIHKEKVVHSDIKPANLMFADVDDLTSLRVVDLGMAAYLQSTRSRAYEVGGTMVYFSPEQVRTWYTKQPGFGFATDIWSAGVVVFEMLSGKQPFTASKVDKTLHRICLMEPRFVGGAVSDNAKDFIRRALAKDPSKRLTAKAALNHPWFAEYKTTNGKPKWLRKLVST
jgi:serine/threonine protein kinase